MARTGSLARTNHGVRADLQLDQNQKQTGRLEKSQEVDSERIAMEVHQDSKEMEVTLRQEKINSHGRAIFPSLVLIAINHVVKESPHSAEN